MKQKRVGLQIAVSKQFMYDSGVDLSEYVKGLLVRRVGKAIEKSILTGTASYEFKGIAHDESLAFSDISSALTVEELRRIYLKVHEHFVDNSTWYMSRAFFEKVVVLKDETGSYYVKSMYIDGQIVQTLFGCPIEVSDALDSGDNTGQVPVLFGSIKDCYTIGISKDLTIDSIDGDTIHALRGSTGFTAEFYGDGMVTNYQAIARGIII